MLSEFFTDLQIRFKDKFEVKYKYAHYVLLKWPL